MVGFPDLVAVAQAYGQSLPTAVASVIPDAVRSEEQLAPARPTITLLSPVRKTLIGAPCFGSKTRTHHHLLRAARRDLAASACSLLPQPIRQLIRSGEASGSTRPGWGHRASLTQHDPRHVVGLVRVNRHEYHLARRLVALQNPLNQFVARVPLRRVDFPLTAAAGKPSKTVKKRGRELEIACRAERGVAAAVERSIRNS